MVSKSTFSLEIIQLDQFSLLAGKISSTWSVKKLQINCTVHVSFCMLPSNLGQRQIENGGWREFTHQREVPIMGVGTFRRKLFWKKVLKTITFWLLKVSYLINNSFFNFFKIIIVFTDKRSNFSLQYTMCYILYIS